MTIGKFLREQRKAAGLTGHQASMATDIPMNQLYEYENDRTVPNTKRFITLALLYADKTGGERTLDLTQLDQEMEDTGRTKGLYSDLAPSSVRMAA